MQRVDASPAPYLAKRARSDATNPDPALVNKPSAATAEVLASSLWGADGK